MVVLPEVDSTSHKSWTASARATARKILRCKHFRKQKIIAPQAQSQL